MKQKTTPFKTNRFYVDAEFYRTHLTEEEEIMKINYTEEFMTEVENMIKNGEIVIGNINAKMRLGKSTLAIALGIWTYNLLKKHGYRKKNEYFNISNIARDQQEKSKMMRDPKLQHTCIVTDENNELEEGGENATSEYALRKVFSDVQAGRYVHGWNCSPKDTTDDNADIMLSVVAIDKKSKITRSKLYYRYYEGGQQFTQLLGFVDFYVGDLIKNWDNKIKKIFLKENKIEEEKKLIETYAKKDFYVEYMIKKYEKMELITKHGIMRPRMLDYAEVVTEVINKLIPLTKQEGILNDKIIKNYIKMEMTKAKIPTSIVGIQLASGEASGVLDLYKSFHKMNKKIKKLNEALKNPKQVNHWNEIAEELATIKIIRDEIFNAIEIQKEEYNKMIMLNKKYNQHLGEKNDL